MGVVMGTPLTPNHKHGAAPHPPALHLYPQVLEDIALTIQTQLVAKVPFCAFNGGNDVFVDVGNKLLGLEALMKYLQVSPPEVGRITSGWEVQDRRGASASD